jgi:hypothetical protein
MLSAARRRAAAESDKLEQELAARRVMLRRQIPANILRM